MSARTAAYEVLEQVFLHEGYASLLMRNRWNTLEESQRPLATQLVYGTLQNYRYLRYQWEGYTDGKLPGKIRVLLDMAMYQWLFLDKCPEYAVADETVRFAKTLHKGSYTKAVNAILRKVFQNGIRPLPEDKLEALAIRTSYPTWLLKMWQTHYGEEIMQRMAMEQPRTELTACRVFTPEITVEEVLKNPVFTKGQLAEHSVLCHGNVLETEEFRSHKIVIQDEASQMVVQCMQPNGHILDMCSAPGTKAIQMAQRMKYGDIICIDLHPQRVRLIEQAVKNHHVDSIRTMCMDSTKVHEVFDPQSFDMILLDAPCSGLGTVLQKPDIKIRIKPENIVEIVGLQQCLLEAAYPLLKVGGTLMYSTCTVNKKENDRQIERFLQIHPDMETVLQKTYFPFEHNTDGFFMAKLVKREKESVIQ